MNVILPALFMCLLMAGIVRAIYAASIRVQQRDILEQKALARGSVVSDKSDVFKSLGEIARLFRTLRSGYNTKLEDVKYALINNRYRIWYSLLVYRTLRKSVASSDKTHKRHLFLLLDPSSDQFLPYVCVRNYCTLHNHVIDPVSSLEVNTAQKKVSCWPKISRLFPITMRFETYPNMVEKVAAMWSDGLVDELLKGSGENYCLEILGNVVIIAYDYELDLRFGDRFDARVDYLLGLAAKLRTISSS